MSEDNGSNGRAPPTIIDISYKLRRLCDMAHIDRSKLKTDLHEKYRIAPRTVESWFNQTDASVRHNGRDKLIEYFRDVHNIYLGYADFSTSRAEFDRICESLPRAVNGNGSGSPANELILNFGEALTPIPPAERSYIAGTYDLYRFSFSGTRAITQELLYVEPAPDSTTNFRVQMYCHPVDSDGETESVELFQGSIYRFGRSYNIVSSYSNGVNDRRTRFVQFPANEQMKRRIHFGIVMGFSASLDEPVGARVVVKKVSQLTKPQKGDFRKVRRMEPDDPTVTKYAQLLEKEPHADVTWMMTVDKRKVASGY